MSWPPHLDPAPTKKQKKDLPDDRGSRGVYHLRQVILLSHNHLDLGALAGLESGVEEAVVGVGVWDLETAG